MTKADEEWFAVRLAGNALSTAIQKRGVVGPRRGRKLVRITPEDAAYVGETVLARECRLASVRQYVPRAMQFTHRNAESKIVVRPLYPGYGFIQTPDFYRLDDVPSILHPLMNDNRPVVIKGDLMERLRKIEADMSDKAEMARRRSEEGGRRSLRRIYKIGDDVTIDHPLIGSIVARVLDVQSADTVRVLADRLSHSQPLVVSADWLRTGTDGA